VTDDEADAGGLAIALTGAAGTLGRCLRAELAGLGPLRLLDIRPDTPEYELVDLRDLETTAQAFAGCDAVVHLAGRSSEGTLDELYEANIRTCHTVFEAAVRAGVPRVVWASSDHATGFLKTSESASPEGPPRPDSLYGVSKVAGEALASLYADKYGLTTISVRLGRFAERPATVRDLAVWLSPGDAGRLFRACLTGSATGHTVVYGCSANPQRYYDLSSATALGYHPVDNAEDYLDEVYPDAGWIWQGGDFTET
jgi:uronate dehydrogenase